MIAFDFCGFAALPGSILHECLDAAGIDLGLDDHAGALAKTLPMPARQDDHPAG